MSNKDIEITIVSELSKIYHGEPRDNLIKVAKIAVSEVDQLILEHNNNQKSNDGSKVNSIKNNEMILSHNVMPVLSLSFAEKLLTHNDEHTKGYDDALYKISNSSASLEHSANIVKSSFKLQLTHDTMSYDHHQQQQMQRQIVQHYSAEI